MSCNEATLFSVTYSNLFLRLLANTGVTASWLAAVCKIERLVATWYLQTAHNYPLNYIRSYVSGFLQIRSHI